MRLRKGDLDHIVDSLSDDEGDEEAALKAMAEMQRKEDQDRTRMVITAVTEGHDALKNKRKKLGYTFDQLIGAEGTANGNNPDQEGGAAGQGVEEYDMEELLQRGLQQKKERERGRYAESDDEDEEGESYDSDEELERMKELLSTMTEEERAAEIANMKRMKEQEKMEALNRKQMEKEFKMRRELRLQAIKRQKTADRPSSTTPTPLGSASFNFFSSLNSNSQMGIPNESSQKTFPKEVMRPTSFPP